MHQAIKSRKQFLLKNINKMKNEILIEKQLIQLEEESIELIKSGEDIGNINTDISNKALFASQVPVKEIIKKEENVIENVIENKECNGINKDEYLKIRDEIADVTFFDSIKEKLDNLKGVI